MLVHIFWDSQSPDGFQVPVSRIISSVLNIRTVIKHRHHMTQPVLLVVHQDLFRNGNSFVFGLAREQVGAGVVSTARLGNEFYRRQNSDDDYIDRIAKEGAHEIGHLIGLPHCTDRECVMFRPDTLDELDRKKKSLCPACRQRRDAILAIQEPAGARRAS